MAEKFPSTAEQETHRRLGLFLTVFRISGIPVMFNNVSKLFKLYIAVALFFSSVTFMAIVADIYVNLEDIERIMETIRMLFPAGIGLWIQIFMR
jgi:hypothetical protein